LDLTHTYATQLLFQDVVADPSTLLGTRNVRGEGHVCSILAIHTCAAAREHSVPSCPGSKLQLWRLAPLVSLELTFYRSDFASEAAARFGVERVDARTVRLVVRSAAEVCRF
jgi:D-aminopeptidase